MEFKGTREYKKKSFTRVIIYYDARFSSYSLAARMDPQYIIRNDPHRLCNL